MEAAAAAEEAERQARLAAQRQAEEARLREAARERQAEAERQRQLQAEADRIAEDEERRLAEELAQQRIDEEARLLAEAAQRELAALDAQRTRESEATSNQAAERISREIDRYIPVIQDRIRQYWARPAVAADGLVTVVSLRLIPGGDVVPSSVRVVRGSGNTAFDQSVIAAVYNAGSLPVPSGPAFENFREFTLTFRP
jgi:colicin import membrane protein